MAKLKCAAHGKRVQYWFNQQNELVVVHRHSGDGHCKLPLRMAEKVIIEEDALPGCPPERRAQIRSLRTAARKAARASRHRRSSSNGTLEPSPAV